MLFDDALSLSQRADKKTCVHTNMDPSLYMYIDVYHLNMSHGFLFLVSALVFLWDIA